MVRTASAQLLCQLTQVLHRYVLKQGPASRGASASRLISAPRATAWRQCCVAGAGPARGAAGVGWACQGHAWQCADCAAARLGRAPPGGPPRQEHPSPPPRTPSPCRLPAAPPLPWRSLQALPVRLGSPPRRSRVSWSNAAFLLRPCKPQRTLLGQQPEQLARPAQLQLRLERLLAPAGGGQQEGQLARLAHPAASASAACKSLARLAEARAARSCTSALGACSPRAACASSARSSRQPQHSGKGRAGMPPRGAALNRRGYSQLKMHAAQLVGWCLLIRLTPYVLDALQQQRQGQL